MKILVLSYAKVVKKSKIILPVVKKKWVLTRHYSSLVNMANIAMDSYVDGTINRYIL